MSALQLFRSEAIEHQRTHGSRADVLRLDPGATTWGFGLLCLGIAAAVLFVALGRLNEYASGPAFVRLSGHTTLNRNFATIVDRVEVAPGESVSEGQVLVRFHAPEELAELDAVTREFDDELGKLLQHPNDATARGSLASLRTRRDIAKTHVEQLTLRSPHAGTVTDVRVREGQRVEAGLPVLELQESTSDATVVALLPGRYRALIKVGEPVRFELDGFQRRAHELVLSSVGEEVVGPLEAARYLGRDVADALPITGPVVVVQARLPKTTFDMDGHPYAFSNGMYGKAETVVRNEPIAYAFVPTLKHWGEKFKPHAWRAYVARWF